MSIKRILVPLPASLDLTAEVEMALAAANTLQAHIEALFIDQPPPMPAGVSSGAAYEYAMAGAGTPMRGTIGDVITQQAEERDRLAQRAQDHFVAACAASGVPYSEAQAEFGAPPTAVWRRVEGPYEKTTVNRAVAFDMVVAMSAAIADPLKDIAETTLLQLRRPVLLAPESREGSLTDTAMIAWDASPECWHAVTAALPFLERVQSVQIVSVDKDESSRSASQQELLVYLRCHGIEATAKVVAPRNAWSVGNTLLAVAAEEGVDLLVMGAYSHSRLREMLLGGVTRHVLANATATPIVMAH
jgi:nucleotide-binding universal stress UspA family protein